MTKRICSECGRRLEKHEDFVCGACSKKWTNKELFFGIAGWIGFVVLVLLIAMMLV